MELHRTVLQHIERVSSITLLDNDVLDGEVHVGKGPEHLLLLGRAAPLEERIARHGRVEQLLHAARLHRLVDVDRALAARAVDQRGREPS